MTWRQLFDQMYGNAADTAKGRQMPNHFSFRAHNLVSISSPIGTQITQAAGTARAMQIRGDKLATWVYFGDGGTSEGEFHSGLNFAGVWKAPCVFICENNHWAISVPAEKQTASATFADKAIAYGMPGVRVDGNDVLAVYQAAKEARERAVAGHGPDAHRDRHVPPGPPLVVRRPQALPGAGAARGVAEEGPDRPLPGVPQVARSSGRRPGRRS